MSKQTALYVMLAGVLGSAYDLFTTKTGENGGALYKAGAPLEKLRFEVYKTAEGKIYYGSVTDAMAIGGAFFYFR